MFDAEPHEPGVAGISYVEEPEGFTEAEQRSKERFLEVTRLPIPTLQEFGYRPNLTGRRSGTGFEVKIERTSGDLKFDMHSTLEHLPDQLEIADRVDPTGTFRRYLETVPAFLEAAEPAIIAQARFYEDICGNMPGYADHIRGAKRTWMLRALRYPAGMVRAGGVLAEMHTDKGDFTLDGRADHGVMQYLERASPSPIWRPVKKISGHIVFMPSVCLQARARCRVIGAGHQVIATEGTHLHGRTVLVVFVDSLHGPCFNKDLYGSQQDMWRKKFAYNYSTQPPEQFYEEEFQYYFNARD